MADKRAKNVLNRRAFLKTTGAAGAVVGGAGVSMFGLAAGKDPNSYTGLESSQGSAQNFNRERFAVDQPHYVRDQVSQPDRIDARTEVVFSRFYKLLQIWKQGTTTLADLPEPMQSYYRTHTTEFEADLHYVTKLYPLLRKDHKRYGDSLTLAGAWSDAMSSVWPKWDSDPPEVADFPKVDQHGELQAPLKMKHPTKTSKLIKKVAHQMGSTLVGITKLNPDWVYRYPMKRSGFPQNEPIEVPAHWQYAIVVGLPMSWDPFLANPNYGTSFDAYSRSRVLAFRLAAFIKKLGYAARPHVPGTDYDLVVPPIVIDAGLGEQGRHSIVVTPELGSNFRPAVVTTNLPLAPDKPIEFGVQNFCKSCKICAENCPSGAISTGDKVVSRGYRRYQLDISKCHNFWGSNLGPVGCRLCVTSCPYSRKSNWLHRTALTLSSNDPTGMVDPALTWLQKRFFEGPEASKYYMPSLGGENASYREPPWWLVAEDFIDFKG